MISLNKGSTIILVAVRLKSKRLKNKALLPIMRKPLIHVLYNRLLTVRNSKKIVLCTSTNKQDDPIYHFAKKNNILCVRGSELNVISRFLKAAKLHKAKNVVRVTGDNPLTDPKMIDKMILNHKKNNSDYTYCDQIPNGTRSEVISTKALEFCLKNVRYPNNSEYMTWMLNRPDIYKVNSIKIRNKKIKYPNLNFTVDNKNEYLNIVRIFKHFNSNDFSLEELIKYVISNKKYLKDYKLKKSKGMHSINIKYKFEK